MKAPRAVGLVRNHRATGTAEAFARALDDLGETMCLLEAEALTWNGSALSGTVPPLFPVTHVLPPLLYGEPGAAAALSEAARHGVCMLNTPEAIAVADDKALAAQRLIETEVPQPETVILDAHEVAARQWEKLDRLSWPVVAKRPNGALGMWVRLCRNHSDLNLAAVELSVEGPTNLVIQEAAIESLGRATRALVLTGEVVLSTERIAPEGEWRSNVAQGAKQHLVRLTSEEEEVAQGAAAACGLGWAGVDLVRTSSGPLVLEVNASPGFTSMQSHCSWSIAGRVVNELLGTSSSFL